MGKHSWFLFSDDKLSFYTKMCVAESSWEKMITLWGQVIVAWQCILVASVNNVMTFSAYISDRNILFEMTDSVQWETLSPIKFQPSYGAVDSLGSLGALC